MMQSLEDQHYQQELDKENQFKDWFYGSEIQGDSTAAVHYLAENIGKLSSMENLMDAYFYVEPKKPSVESHYSDGSIVDDDLPF